MDCFPSPGRTFCVLWCGWDGRQFFSNTVIRSHPTPAPRLNGAEHKEATAR